MHTVKAYKWKMELVGDGNGLSWFCLTFVKRREFRRIGRIRRKDVVLEI